MIPFMVAYVELFEGVGENWWLGYICWLFGIGEENSSEDEDRPRNL